MSVRRGKSKVDPLAPHEETLLKLINAQKDHLKLFTLYFANAREADSPRVTEVDHAGLTLRYREKSFVSKSNDLVDKEIRIQFNNPAYDLEGAKKQIAVLVKEAKDVTSTKVDKTYVPPGREQPRLFIPPSLQTVVYGLGLWGILLAAGFYHNIPPKIGYYHYALGGHELFRGVAIGIGAIHVVEAVVAIIIGITSGMPMWVNLLVGLLTIPFGLSAIGPHVKCCKKKRLRDGRDQGGIVIG
ncbi:hypothetical protein HDU85_004589 [Gaertneriomyces sp. JEL0708]|nr:hypothetical protein HDU85_004589 [Gaertneriomyces sp. JEL0708]